MATSLDGSSTSPLFVPPTETKLDLRLRFSTTLLLRFRVTPAKTASDRSHYSQRTQTYIFYNLRISYLDPILNFQKHLNKPKCHHPHPGEDNLKPLSHSSTFFKSHVQYNARTLLKRYQKHLKKPNINI